MQETDPTRGFASFGDFVHASLAAKPGDTDPRLRPSPQSDLLQFGLTEEQLCELERYADSLLPDEPPLARGHR